MKVAVIGTGISGMLAAYLLSRRHEVVVFEAEDYVVRRHRAGPARAPVGLDALPKEALLTGHGHVGGVCEIPAGLRAPTMGDVTIWRPRSEDRHFTVPLRPERRYWVRNAAVGGPYLDNFVASNWAEYRPGDCVILHREVYDTQEFQADIHAHRHVMTNRDTWQTRVLKLLTAQTQTP